MHYTSPELLSYTKQISMTQLWLLSCCWLQ